MKANEKIKESIEIERIYEMIMSTPSEVFKLQLHHSIFVSDEVKLKLMKDGFKVYIGDWDGIMKDCLIIEW